MYFDVSETFALLQYIEDIDEEENSMISRVLQLQVEQPTKGDWASSWLADLKQIKSKVNVGWLVR